MESTSPGELVRVAGDGPALDAIVYDTPSKTKAVVAVVQASRGPVLRTVPTAALIARAEDGPDDRALRLLNRRTPPPTRSTTRGWSRGGGGQAGFTRGAAHRTTGR